MFRSFRPEKLSQINELLDKYPELDQISADLDILRQNSGLDALPTLELRIDNLIRYYNPWKLPRQVASGYFLPLIEKEKKQRIFRTEIRKRKALRKAQVKREFLEALRIIREIKTTRKHSIKAGYIYLVGNKAFTGWIKIGCALDVNQRLSSYQTSDPHRNFEVLFKRFVPDRRLAEQTLLLATSHLNRQGEWIQSEKSTIVEIFRKVQKELLTL